MQRWRQRWRSSSFKTHRHRGKRTGNSQVAVRLDLPCQVASEALEHPRVVWQEAVDLQAASDQHSVPGDLHWTDGHRVLVPHNVWLWRACTQERVSCRTVCPFSPATKIFFFPPYFLKKKNPVRMKTHLWPGRGCPPPSPSRR